MGRLGVTRQLMSPSEFQHKIHLPMKHSSTTYYGFSSASSSEEPAWFYTADAALRFANECGWRTGEDQQPLTIDDVETTDDPDPDDIMDEPLELNFAGWFLRAVEGPEINPADLERLVAAARESVANP
jgi:hypothetical protein